MERCSLLSVRNQQTADKNLASEALEQYSKLSSHASFERSCRPHCPSSVLNAKSEECAAQTGERGGAPCVRSVGNTKWLRKHQRRPLQRYSTLDSRCLTVSVKRCRLTNGISWCIIPHDVSRKWREGFSLKWTVAHCRKQSDLKTLLARWPVRAVWLTSVHFISYFILVCEGSDPITGQERLVEREREVLAAARKPPCSYTAHSV